MKSKLIILSDLWGSENSLWTKEYLSKLESFFEISFYDCCEFAEITYANSTEESRHNQFVNGGIDKAVRNLNKLNIKDTIILGFSIGGTIGWKYALLNNNVIALFAISSTRLRYETIKPKCNIKLIFGNDDQYKPNENWITELNVKVELVSNIGHDIYKNKTYINSICNKILTVSSQKNLNAEKATGF
jgi:hypothetical protein